MKEWHYYGLFIFLGLVLLSVFVTTIYEFRSDNYKESFMNLFSGSKTITEAVGGGGGGQQGGGAGAIPEGNCVLVRYDSYDFWEDVEGSNSPVDYRACKNNWATSYFRKHDTPTGCETFPVTYNVVSYDLPYSLAGTNGRTYLQTSECSGVEGYVLSEDSPYKKTISGSGNVSTFIVIPLCGADREVWHTLVPFGYSGEGYPAYINRVDCGQDCIMNDDGEYYVRAYYIKPQFNLATEGTYTLCWN